jgi:uncharacterized membrane protein YkoI
MRRHLLSATVLSLLIGSAAAVAQVRTGAAAPSYSAGQPAAPGPMMSEQQLLQQLNQQGYTSVGMIKLKGDTYEARAFKGGQSLAIEVDARTGKVLSADPAVRD